MSAHEDDAGRVCSMCGVTFDVHATLSPKCTGEPAAGPEGHELGGCLYLINECVWVCAPGCRAARPEGEPPRKKVMAVWVATGHWDYEGGEVIGVGRTKRAAGDLIRASKSSYDRTEVTRWRVR